MCIVILLRAHYLHPPAPFLRVYLLVDLFDYILYLSIPTPLTPRADFFLNLHLYALHMLSISLLLK